ncbi:putative quinol monooxygenase [Pelagerythrobacter marensis]|uniref:Antibiotic biosynthesis monooxygenase-like protein n=1 Tax=Pelagerythrobacter marensis TaxID=543877 RepID=A0A0G3XAW9_9SPHN|nr:putative quinol monooxygenase [Pelagerythrobacter marensis]AKM07776.1 Antibiotic biosynthesis monooxygenase-like protein [Pelagerythrobacter marensis]
MPLSVFATISPKPAHFDQARSAVREILAPTRAESGCLAFDLHEGEGNGQLHLYEVWTDRAALDAHYRQDYTRAVFEQYEDWLAEPVAIVFMQPVEGPACSS